MSDPRCFQNNFNYEEKPTDSIFTDREYAVKFGEFASSCFMSSAQRDASGDQSVYTGQLGVDILNQRLQQFDGKPRNFTPHDNFSRDKESFFTGRAGYLAIAIARNHSNSTKYASDLLQIAKNADQKGWPAEEFLYGRSGWLLAVSYAIKFQPQIEEMFKTEISAQIYKLYAAGLKKDGVLHYSWYKENYLGAAHGVAGILQAFLMFRKYWKDAEIFGRLDAGEIGRSVKKSGDYYLSKFSFPSGNVRCVEEDQNDKLLHWCHGAPGWVLTSILLGRMDCAAKQAEVVWKRGMLRKGLGLCHGFSGNAYCFLQMYQATGEEKWLNAAKYFVLEGLRRFDELKNVPDSPCSLFEGIMGFACLLLDIHNPQDARFPGLDYISLPQQKQSQQFSA